MDMDVVKNIFWGLVVKPGKRYETVVQEPFRITKACLEPTAGTGKVSSVYVECDNNEEFIIANLNVKNLNETIDLSFNEGEKICFKVDGPGTVHLTGNLLDDPPTTDMYGMEESDTEQSEDDDAITNGIKDEPRKEVEHLKRKKDEAGEGKAKKIKVDKIDTTVDTTIGDLDDTENFAEENSSESDGDDTEEESDSEIEENTTAGEATKNIIDNKETDNESDDGSEDSSEEEATNNDMVVKEKCTETQTKKESGKADPKKKNNDKNQNEKTPKSKTKPLPEQTPSNKIGSEKTAENKIKKDKSPKQESQISSLVHETPKQEDKKTPEKKPKTPKESQTPGKTPKRTLKGGIQVEDIKEGSGQECKPGNMVGMYYEGCLKENNKKFDSLQAGKPFKFKLGSGQVIKGWDVGVIGMKVGGKRRLTIPPKLGYGGQGSPPDIPPHATLVFDIECKFVK